MIERNISTHEIKASLGSLGQFAEQLVNQGICIKELNSKEAEMAYRLHDELMLRDLPISSFKRKSAWHEGWNENYNLLRLEHKDALIPKYFGKFPYVRFQKKFYGANLSTEIGFLRTILLNEIEFLIERYAPKRVIEFGCGTGHNLFFLNSWFPNIDYSGTDWAEASSTIIDLAREKFKVTNVTAGSIFNYFSPDMNFEVKSTDLVITVASLEQVGTQHQAFIDFIVAKKPKAVLNIEPEASLLDSDDRFDETSIKYMQKRGYLSGYLAELRAREERGELTILKSMRTSLGSFPMDGYSIILWIPAYVE